MKDILHYTPEKTANYLVGSSLLTESHAVADFCVGDGSLIRAAAAKWPTARLFINDVDKDALGSASKKVPSALASSVDFLSAELPEKLSLLGFDRFSTIVLNPPFANRGAKRWQPRGLFDRVDCSRAMAFLLTATTHLEENGEILAILPASTLHSDLDNEARLILKDICNFEFLTKPELGVFPKISATTYIARISNIRPYKSPAILGKEENTHNSEYRTLSSILRGNLSTKKSERIATSSAIGMIHTTSIKQGKVAEIYGLTPEQEARGRKLNTGHYVLLPRVGKVRPDNLCVIHTERPVILSDCLFAIRCKDDITANDILKRLIQKFGKFTTLYNGTGAPYLTRAHLADFLNQYMPKKVLAGLLECD